MQKTVALFGQCETRSTAQQYIASKYRRRCEIQCDNAWPSFGRYEFLEQRGTKDGEFDLWVFTREFFGIS